MRATVLSWGVTLLSGLALVGACTDEPTAPGSADVRPVTRMRLTVTPASATIATGQVLVLHARMTDQYGDEYEPFGVIWESSEEAMAIVSSGGAVLGMREGQVTITATYQDESRASTIRIVPGSSGKKKAPPADGI
jgi:Big-like domain-containing protein